MSDANWNWAVGATTTSSAGTIAMVIGGPGTSSLQAYTPPATTSAVATTRIVTGLRTGGVCAQLRMALVSKGPRPAPLAAGARLEKRAHHSELWRCLRGQAPRQRQSQIGPTHDRPLPEQVRIEAGIGERPDPTFDPSEGRHVADGIPHEGRDVEFGFPDHWLRIDHDPTASMAQQVVMMKVAVKERRVARVHRCVDLLGLAHEVVIARVIEPAGHEIADPPKGPPTRRRSPEPPRRRHRHVDRLILRQARGVVPRMRTLDQHRAPRPIMSEEPHRTVAGDERQGVRLVIGLVVFDGHDLEHGVIAREGDE